MQKKNLVYWFWHRRKDVDVRIMLYTPFLFIILTFIFTFFFSEIQIIKTINTWYYLTSTIVQSLAAIIAVSGAFFTFKMLGIDREIDEQRKKMVAFIVKQENDKASNLYSYSHEDLSRRFKNTMGSFSSNNYSETVSFFETFEGRPLAEQFQKEALKNWGEIFDTYLEIKKDSIAFLKESLKLLCSTIIICILMLLGSDFIFSHQTLALYLAVISTVLFLVSLYYISTKISNIVK